MSLTGTRRPLLNQLGKCGFPRLYVIWAGMGAPERTKLTRLGTRCKERSRKGLEQSGEAALGVGACRKDRNICSNSSGASEPPTSPCALGQTEGFLDPRRLEAREHELRDAFPACETHARLSEVLHDDAELAAVVGIDRPG